MSKTEWISRRKLTLGAGVLAGLATLTVDTYPVILNDSISYLSHSRALTEAGLVDSGYRQFGYPLWLAIWRGVGSLVEPLALTSLAQRGALLLATLFAVWKLRGPGLILVALLMVPTYTVYSNLLLTESLGVPLAATSAVLLAVLLVEPTQGPSEGDAASRLLVWATAGVAVALAMVRFHYIVIAGVLILALAWKAWRAPSSRLFVTIAAATATLVIGAALVLMSFENRAEYGEFFPTIRGERVQFWTLWQVVVEPNREVIEDQLPRVYLDGNPYTFMGQVDVLPHDEVKERYRDATESILQVAETSMSSERAKSAAAVLRGGRIDDLKTTTAVLAEDVLPGELENRIHRNNFARQHGADGFNETFNDGRVTRAGLISSGPVPHLPLPHASDVFALLLPIAVALLLTGLVSRETRPKACAGVALVISYGALTGWFIIDNFRFLLPAYVAVLVLAAAVAGDLLKRAADAWLSRMGDVT